VSDGRPFTLRRWSQRKLAAARESLPVPADVPPVPQAADTAAAAPLPARDAVVPAAPLPALDTLTFDSDFAAFLRPGVDAGVRRAALRTLLRDPRFNVMDGLDVYIDDYSQPSPMPAALAQALVQARFALVADGAHASGYDGDAVASATVRDEDAAHREQTTTPTPRED